MKTLMSGQPAFQSYRQLLNYVEPELEGILAQESEQGLPSDTYCLV